jgi:signal transduction histidine kinase
MLRELAEALPSLFHRMQDLQQLEMRDRLVERAQKLEMTGQLAAGTVHEVNNAPTAILGHCKLLLMEEEMVAATRESLELILRAGDSARIMVGHFLTMARGQESVPQTTDLNLFVHDSLQLLRRQLARERVELVESLDSHLPMVSVQAGKIQ